MNKKFWWATIIGLVVIWFSHYSATYFSSSKAIEFKKFIELHPHYNRTPTDPKGLKSIPKADRPDLAWEQEFLLTMDPVLKRPTPEKLRETQFQIKEFYKNQLAKGIPGSNSYPWVERGPANVGGRTRALAWDPSDVSGKKVWAGGVTGGLWYNDDITSSSSNWNHIDDFWENISVTGIAFSPISADTIYVGTGEGWGAGASRGAGIWKSTDHGLTWAQIVSTSGLAYINDIVVRNESGKGVVYAASGRFGYQGASAGTNGLFRSVDGINFNEVFPGGTDVASVKIASDNTLWAGTRNGRVYSSTDGTTWNEKHNGSARRTAIAVAPSNANVVYALYEQSNVVASIYKTTDGGDNWVQLNEPADVDNGIPDDDFSRGQAWYDLVIAVDPNNENTVAVGGVDLFVSEDGGFNWEHLSKWSNNNNLSGLPCSNVHADQHAIVFKPGSSEEVIFGNDGGVFYTSSFSTAPSSNVIAARNKDYNVTQYYACALHPGEGSNYALAGAQDNGTQKYTSSGFSNTSQATGGDGGYCFIDQDEPNIQITSYVYNNYYLSTNGGGSFFTTMIGQNNGSFINPADYDDRENILYSNNSATSFYRVTGIGGSRTEDAVTTSVASKATNLKVSPYAPVGTTNLFIGNGVGDVYKLENAHTGSTVTAVKIGDSMSSGSITSIEFGDSEDEILITYGNYGVTSVWYTENGGGNWMNKEGNLPNMPVRWGLLNPNDNNEAIVATELGVWATYNFQDASPIWEPSNKGLANVRVDMLQHRISDDLVIAGTHGRGLFESDGFNHPTLPLNALFSADQTTVNVGAPVNFTSESTGDPEGWQWAFPGGNPNSFVGEIPPTVSYNLPGCYDVTLTVNDDTRDTTRTKTCYITVGLFDGPCVPETSSGTEDGDYIDGVQLGTINNLNTGATGGAYYTNYTSLYTNTELGQSYNLTVYSGTSGPNDFIAWIDYNRDNILQDPEERIGLKTLSANSNGSISFTIPTDATEGFTLLRIKAVYNSKENTGPCSDNEWGEVEDYGIVLIDNINPPKVDFEVSTSLISVGESVDFTDRSSGSPDSWSWDLADGNPASSGDQHPVNVIFNTPGCKTISLETTNQNGTETKAIPCMVEVVEPPVSLFMASDTVIEAGSRISFTDLSTNNPDEWNWQFDGATITSTATQHPQNVKYNTAGCYAVTLQTAYKGISREPLVKTCYITVVEAMITNFTASKTVVKVGETINFSDQTTGDPTDWLWEFEGADILTSTDKNPIGISYANTGCFKVTLTPSRIGNAGDKLERVCFIEVVTEPVAEFASNTTYTRIGETVDFFDLSQGAVTAWNWTFGGTQTPVSLVKFPTVVFDTVGCFKVTLTVFNKGVASQSEVKDCYIYVDYGVGINSLSENDFSIFPNPASEFLIIENDNASIEFVQLFSLQGKMVGDYNLSTSRKNKIEVSSLENGIYFLQWKRAGQIISKKIIIEH
jgi:PKD repeat protein